MPLKTRLLTVLAVMGVLCTSVHAQKADPRSTGDRLSYFELPLKLAEAGRAATPADATQARNDVADVVGNNLYAFVYYAIPPAVVSASFKEFVHSATRTRVDQQIGSPAAAARTGLAALFGFAIESGAVSQSIEQNVVTFRANADGIVRFLSNQDVFSVAPCASHDDACAASGPLKNLEVSTSFTISDSATKTVSGRSPTTGSTTDFSALLTQHQFAKATVRYAIENNRDPRSKAYREKWARWFQKNGSALTTSGQDLLQFVNGAIAKVQATNDGARRDGRQLTLYDTWEAATRTKLAKAPATEAGWQAAMQEQLDDLLARMRSLDPEFDTKLTDLSKAFARYIALRRDLESTIVTDPALTLEYTYAEPALQPKLHTAKVLYAYSPKGQNGGPNPATITFNAGLEFYQDLQPTGTASGPARWKDVQAAVQFDRPLGAADSGSQLSAGAYYQYQLNPNIIVIPAGTTTFPGTSIPVPANASSLLTQSGSIVTAQATITLRLGASGPKVPIGVSWSNKSDLVAGNQVRGHIGFTFDTASLLQLASSLR